MGSVLLLDDDVDVRGCVGELLRVVCGRECVEVGSVAELMAARDRALACDAAILDVNLGAGQPTGLVAYEWLRGQSFCGLVLFLTGHAASHPLVRRAAALDGAGVLAKPVGSDELQAMLTPHPA